MGSTRGAAARSPRGAREAALYSSRQNKTVRMHGFRRRRLALLAARWLLASVEVAAAIPAAASVGAALFDFVRCSKAALARRRGAERRALCRLPREAISRTPPWVFNSVKTMKEFCPFPIGKNLRGNHPSALTWKNTSKREIARDNAQTRGRPFPQVRPSSFAPAWRLCRRDVSPDVACPALLAAAGSHEAEGARAAQQEQGRP